MPKTRPAAVSRRIWMTVAVLGTGALHIYVLERLLNLNPQPAAIPAPRGEPIPVEEWVYEFDAAPLAPPHPTAPPQAVVTVQSPKAVKRPIQVQPSAAASDPVATEYLPAGPTAADLLGQIPQTARETLPDPGAQRRPWLDLGVRADSNDAVIEPERRNAGLGDTPTRGDMAPVGDIANGLLIEKWHQMHHDPGPRDCKRQAAGEPLSVYLGRCKQGL